jgi:hypothetical protein
MPRTRINLESPMSSSDVLFMGDATHSYFRHLKSQSVHSGVLEFALDASSLGIKVSVPPATLLKRSFISLNRGATLMPIIETPVTLLCLRRLC